MPYRMIQRPFKRIGIPGICASLLAFLHAPEEIEKENQGGKAKDKRADRHELIHSLKAD